MLLCFYSQEAEMLLNPRAVQQLRLVTANYDWPYTTHKQRNDLARMFIYEAGRLIDQKQEIELQRLAEQLQNSAITYEEFQSEVAKISEDEGERGSQQGREYA